MGRKRRTGIIICTSGLLLLLVLFMNIHAVIHQSEMDSLIVQIVSEEPTESGTLIEKTELSVVQGEQEKSETLMEENAWIEDTEDDVTAVCEMVRAVDFTVEEPHMELTEEEDRAYKEAFLRLLKNELPIAGGMRARTAIRICGGQAYLMKNFRKSVF